MTSKSIATFTYHSIKNTRIKEISIICKNSNIHHVVNNAYGITCTKVIDILSQSNKVGRIDVIISSTDKNFMVPVGGSLLYSSNEVKSFVKT